MASGWNLLLDLMVTLAGAFFLGALMERFKQSAIIGYILAGVLLGPGVAGVVTSVETVQSLAELGVALLLFSIGLEFSWRDLKRLGRVGLGGGSVQVGVTGLAAYAVALAFGVDHRAAAAVGAVVALSSTVIVTKVLKESGDLDATHGKATVGILVFQDIAFVPLVLLLTFLGGDVANPGGTDGAEGFSGLVIAQIVAAVLLVIAFMPRALRSRALSRNRELPILLAVTICMGAAWGAHAIGLSPSIGAFLGGMALAETTHAVQIRADVGPLRTLFATIFFASVGMLANPQWIAANALPVALTTLAVVIGKAALAFGAVRIFKLPTIASFAVGISLAQIGELSFVLLQLGLSLELLSGDLANLLTAASVITLLVSPYLVASAPDIARPLAIRLISARTLADEERRARKSARELSGHVVLVGFGEAGRSAASSLREAGTEVVVLDTDRKLVSDVRSLGCYAMLGDATQLENLEHAGITRAAGIVVAVSDHRTAKMAVAQARALAPNVPIVARARYHLYKDDIADAGADRVVDEETLIGKRLGDEVSLQLGMLWDHEGRGLR
jgi:CPA2 family monovalent cation:H+ antiporter-2